MNGGPHGPTAADYANSAAHSAQADVRALAARVDRIEQGLRRLIDLIEAQTALEDELRAIREIRDVLERGRLGGI